jgi:acyl dehydratase
MTALITPDIWWEDLQVGSHWLTQGRTLTEPDLVAWLNLTWLTESLFTDHHDRADSAISGRFVPGAMVFAFAEGLTLGAVRIRGLAFLQSELAVKGPTFLGDTIRVRSTVESLRETSKPDRSLCLTGNEVMNQSGQTVLAYTALRMIRRRPPAPGA